ncbi:hypothetical protein [Streptomyces sp. NBRC 109706]|uniref:hypothetical protein n=1 Tax=Streptomyces sp. NBRC 109706 TaxID=1550035 RepID=UPI00078215C5|nr:hypothetical protein [Streptomyces sp. NBRC 109706]
MSDTTDLPATSLPHALTKGQLVRMLSEGDFRDLPDDTPLILSKDAEGNGYSPVSGATLAMYVAETTWSGETYPPDSVIDASDVYGDEDRAPEGAVLVIEFSPVN